MNQENLKERINEHNEKILSQITDYSLPTSKLFKNLVGLKIDKLEVIKFAGRRKRPNMKSDAFYFWCKCECGNVKIFNSQDLCKTTDHVKSCGCLYDRIDIIKYARLHKPNIYHAYISGDENKKSYIIDLGQCIIDVVTHHIINIKIMEEEELKYVMNGHIILMDLKISVNGRYLMAFQKN